MDAAELRQTLVLANAFKEGDLPVGGTRDDRIREDARRALRAVRLGDIRRTPLVDDGVTDALARFVDRRLAGELDALTVAQLTQRLLAPSAPDWIRTYRDGLTSEAIAAAARVMTDDELSAVARAIFNPLADGSTGVAIGSPQHFGSRIQPNSPGDEDEEILFSIFEGLSYGCGDVVLGINPASDDVDSIVRLESLLRQVVERLGLPTRYCVLSDIVKQQQAQQRGRVDVGFQSLAGTSRALSGMVGLDVDGVLDLAAGFDGLYFETGQGSAVTNGAAEHVDMVTLEARAYGVARLIGERTGSWMIVNDVAGFIGPEVFTTPGQLERACLEDAAMAKLHGLTMGLDVCATFHMGIPPAVLESLTSRIAERAAPAYLMAVAGNADPMLGYLTTSFREHPRLRRRTGREITSAMRERLAALDASPAALYAAYMKAGGDARSNASLEDEGRRTLDSIRERGFDLGYGTAADEAAPPQAQQRLDAIYAHARRALYATLDDGVLRDACPHRLEVRTIARDRDDYLAHPPRGEELLPEDARRVAGLYASGAPPVQFVISDGLNADAINELLRAVMPAVRGHLAGAGLRAGEIDVVITNGRVRAGYHVGELVRATAIVHFIGERPGTGLNTASAYMTYGLDEEGRMRWTRSLDHARTGAICGIHRLGTPPASAASEIARRVARMLRERGSGVAARPTVP